MKPITLGLFGVCMLGACADKSGGSGEPEGFVEQCEETTKEYGQEPGGDPSGLEVCEAKEGGALHRPEGAQCPAALADPICSEPTFDATACGPDLACGDGERCAQTDKDTCGCVPACETDDDCETGEACICTNDTSFHFDDGIYRAGCRPASCRVDADCGADALCVASRPCASIDAFACRDDSDCTDADCPKCVLDDGGAWTCANPSCE